MEEFMQITDEIFGDINRIIDDTLEECKGLDPKYRAVEQAAGFREIIKYLEQLGFRKEED